MFPADSLTIVPVVSVCNPLASFFYRPPHFYQKARELLLGAQRLGCQRPAAPERLVTDRVVIPIPNHRKIKTTGAVLFSGAPRVHPRHPEHRPGARARKGPSIACQPRYVGRHTQSLHSARWHDACLTTRHGASWMTLQAVTISQTFHSKNTGKNIEFLCSDRTAVYWGDLMLDRLAPRMTPSRASNGHRRIANEFVRTGYDCVAS